MDEFLVNLALEMYNETWSISLILFVSVQYKPYFTWNLKFIL
jgi:hypothetical protein